MSIVIFRNGKFDSISVKIEKIYQWSMSIVIFRNGKFDSISVKIEKSTI